MVNKDGGKVWTGFTSTGTQTNGGFREAHNNPWVP